MWRAGNPGSKDTASINVIAETLSTLQTRL